MKGLGVEVVALGHGAELDFRVRQVAAFEAGSGLLQKPLYRRIGLERLFLLALLFTPLLAVHRFIPWLDNIKSGPQGIVSNCLELSWPPFVSKQKASVIMWAAS